jgi:hypothetical protein
VVGGWGSKRRNDLSVKTTRRKFLKAVGAGAAWIVLTNMPGCEPAGGTQKKMPSTTVSPVQPKTAQTGHSQSAQPEYVRTFRSRPDLSPPAVEVSTQAHNTAPGYIFVAPKGYPGHDGPMILDNRGQPVWFHQSKDGVASDFKVQHYRGEPVLTWAEGRVVAGHGLSEYVILDSSYRELKRVRAGNGYKGDLHEFLITQQDTALFTIYSPVRRDLTSVGGSRYGGVVDGIVQEVNIETGEVLFEWHSLEHVSIEESYGEPPKNPRLSFDYLHINSIDVDHDSNLLVSGHKAFTVYKIDRESGEIIWRLGGKKSDFEMGEGTRTGFQHDARRQPDGTITIFDNGGVHKNEQSYGLVLELDEEEMTATLVREYAHPEERLAATMGNMQVLPNANVFIGWGNQPLFSEFSNEGKLLFDASFPSKVESYRAFRFAWRAHPSEEPAIAAERGSENEVTIYASWNGATEVSSWRVLAGPSPERLEPIGSAVRREGFETAIVVSTAEPYVGVRAEDGSGRVLGTSSAIKPGN